MICDCEDCSACCSRNGIIETLERQPYVPSYPHSLLHDRIYMQANKDMQLEEDSSYFGTNHFLASTSHDYVHAKYVPTAVWSAASSETRTSRIPASGKCHELCERLREPSLLSHGWMLAGKSITTIRGKSAATATVVLSVILRRQNC